jgi:opacity protein-like surface antigen
MKKAILFAVVAAAMMASAAFAAAPAQKPTGFCKANPDSIGTGAGKLYPNFGACVKAQADKQETNATNAAKTCKAERTSIGGDAFTTKYGTNKKSNAFGKCVSKIASTKTGEQQSAEVNAVKKCRTAENAAKIGTGAGKTWRNFGACVKAQSKSS